MRKHLLHKLHMIKEKKLSKLEQFLLALLLLGALGLIALSLNVIYLNWPQPSVAAYLPADKTVMFAEVNGFSFPAKMEATGDQSRIIQLMGQPFGLDLLAALRSFGQDSLGLAVLRDQTLGNQPVLFVRAKSQHSALSYFQTLLLPNEELVKSPDRNPIYTYAQGQTFSFRFVKRFVAIAKSPDVLKLVGDESVKSLSADDNYRKSVGNLPRRSWILGFVDFENLNFSDNPAVDNIIEPLKNALRHVAFTVRKDQEGFHFNTFLNLDKDLLSLKRGPSEGKFTYNLTNSLLDDGLGVYIGGADLQAEWLNTLETISNLNPAYGVILEGLVRAQAENVFGAEVDLRNDLYPLFAGEYALSLGNGPNGHIITLILSTDNPGFAKTKLKKLAQGFKFLAAKFAPKVAVVKLPDGTESRELVPDNAKLETTEETVGGYTIDCTVVSGTDAGFCYTVTDQNIVVTNAKDSLLKTLDPKNAPLLSQDAGFRKTLANLSKVSDEVTYVNFDNFIKFFETNPYVQALQPILSKLQAGSWVKHYFTDGMSAEGYILVK